MSTHQSLQEKLADKVWSTLFGGGDSALLPPWRLRDKKRNHKAVREAELAATQTMLDELDELHAGRKAFNHRGELVDVAEDDLMPSIKLSHFIEQAEEDPLNALRIPGTAEALRKVRLEADILALRHSLNLRRIGLRADILAENFVLESLSERAVDADWLLRWKEAAARAVASDFQDMWARVLVDEVRQPGTHSLRALAFLGTLSRDEMTTLRFMTALDLGGFVCREAPKYFHAEIHAPMFVQMQSMELMEKSLGGRVVLKTVASDGFRAVLRCQNKALYIEGESDELMLSASLFTPLGREVMALFTGMPDTGYLFAIGNALKKRGYRIDIGDWHGEADGSGLFSEKINL
jgi:hypothetical protein